MSDCSSKIVAKPVIHLVAVNSRYLPSGLTALVHISTIPCYSVNIYYICTPISTLYAGVPCHLRFWKIATLVLALLLAHFLSGQKSPEKAR